MVRKERNMVGKRAIRTPHVEIRTAVDCMGNEVTGIMCRKTDPMVMTIRKLLWLDRESRHGRISNLHFKEIARLLEEEVPREPGVGRRWDHNYIRAIMIDCRLPVKDPVKTATAERRLGVDKQAKDNAALQRRIKALEKRLKEIEDEKPMDTRDSLLGTPVPDLPAYFGDGSKKDAPFRHPLDIPTSGSVNVVFPKGMQYKEEPKRPNGEREASE